MPVYVFDEDFGNPFNPFRGPSQGVQAETQATDITNARAQGYNVLKLYFQIPVTSGDIPGSWLTSVLQNRLALAAAAGITVIPRFYVWWPGTRNYAGVDVTLAQVKRWVDQVKPYLVAMQDYIHAIQFGFFGFYGEWHFSGYAGGGDLVGRCNTADQNALARYMMDTLPGFDFQTRKPQQMRDFNGNTPLLRAAAFGTSDKARLGWYNDYIYGNVWEGGTWNPPYASDPNYTYANAIRTLVKVNGETGETFDPTGRTDLLAWMRSIGYTTFSNWSAGATAYWPIATWNELKRTLGYALRLDSVNLPSQLAPGDKLDMSISITNVGMAPVFHPHPIQVVLVGQTGQGTYYVDSGIDIHDFDPLLPVTKTLSLTLPTLPTGSYDVHLKIPHANPAITDVRYCIQLLSKYAGASIYNAGTGLNHLGGVTFVVAATQVSSPVISAVAAGQNKTVTITCSTAGATIRYTTDGTVPSAINGITYAGSFLVTQNSTVNAYAFKAGSTDSVMTSADYQFACADVVASLSGGTFPDPQTVTLSCSTTGASIYYTLDGTAPAGGVLYTGAITIPSTSRLRAVAIKDGWANSNNFDATYTITPSHQIASMTSSYLNGNITVTVTLNQPLYATIWLTLNGKLIYGPKTSTVSNTTHTFVIPYTPPTQSTSLHPVIPVAIPIVIPHSEQGKGSVALKTRTK